MNSDVSVLLDDRVRLLSAALAATDLPERAQAQHPHGVHPHARALQQHLAPLRDHAAVQMLQALLDDGVPLDALFTLVLSCELSDLDVVSLPDWCPPGLPLALRDLLTRADLPARWRAEDAAWNASLSQARRVLESACFEPFLQACFGEVREQFVFMPNILFPTHQEIGARIGSVLVAIVPPRLAWGTNPPWPFDEDPAYVLRAALAQYVRLLLEPLLDDGAEQVTAAAQAALPVSAEFAARYPVWADQFTRLFTAGLVAIYLEDHVNPAEARAYVLMERKVSGIDLLPAVVSVLRRYANEKEAGRYQSLLDFLPVFPKQLRVAKRLVNA